jgi:hypothetical protein
MKRKKDDEMVQTAVRLPQSLRDKLSKAGGDGGLGEEIRNRLEASFDAERAPGSPKTHELLDAVHSFAKEVTDYYGDPAEDAFAADALKACLDLLMAHDRPPGEAVAHPNPESAADLLFAPDHLPREISRTLVTAWIRDRRKRAFADEEKRSREGSP